VLTWPLGHCVHMYAPPCVRPTIRMEKNRTCDALSGGVVVSLFMCVLCIVCLCVCLCVYVSFGVFYVCVCYSAYECML
jgi:hypothetical protein